jgi:hypothetical protein
MCHFSSLSYFSVIYSLHSLQDGRIDYSEFVAMMQDTGFGKKGLQNNMSIAKHLRVNI